MIKINNVLIKPTIFPDNTQQVWNININAIAKKLPEVFVEWKYEGDQELVTLLQAMHLIHKKYYNQIENKVLFMPYLPYGRQDKEVSNEETFGLSTLAHTLKNMIGFDKYITVDAHSNKFSTLFVNTEDIFPKDQIKNAIREFGSEILVFPDKGAVYRYAAKFPNYAFISGNKERDQFTGRITKLTVDTFGHIIIGRRVLIVDDLCDGGGTFIMMAKQLQKLNVQEIGLYVSHGIFSRGIEPLVDAGITKIATYDEVLRK